MTVSSVAHTEFKMAKLQAILIRDYYIEDDCVVYTGNDTVMPIGKDDWVDCVQDWADKRIPNWQNLECFRLTATGLGIER